MIIYIKHIAIIHSYRASVINADNKLITFIAIFSLLFSLGGCQFREDKDNPLSGKNTDEQVLINPERNGDG